MSAVAPIPLADGLVLRTATVDDVEDIVALNVAAFGAQDGPDVRAFLSEPDLLDAWSVVADGDRAVSAIARIDHRMQFDGMPFTAAQIEYVVTDEHYRQRGLVAAQMDWHHQRCAEAGIPVQMIGGIPYFYRRFGYGYGLEDASLFVFDAARVEAARDGTVSVRRARPDDLDAILALEDERPALGLRVVRDAQVWHRVLHMCDGSDFAEILVAEDHDVVTGWARLFDHPNENRTFLLPSVARSADAVTALVRAALDHAAGRTLVAFDSPGTVFADQLRQLGAPFLLGLGYYVRIPDPIGFLEWLRPILSRRLAASTLASETGTLEISLYTYGVALDYASGEVVAVRRIPAVQDPTDVEGIGVAPDWFPALAFGRWKATDLARRVDDVLVLRDHQLMNVLFPWRPSDVSGDF